MGWEVDPYAIPLLQTANRTGARVVLRHVAGTEDLAASVGAAHPPGTPLLKWSVSCEPIADRSC